mmetsp:Transcript_8664/g.28892  ORF Transcript_8664/g.28892 Transcript_8664/m.28892 type:complete len:123 (-) Transcript_8664:1385-1753(-)
MARVQEVTGSATEEAMARVMEWVGGKDIGRMAACSTSMREHASREELWQTLCRRDFGILHPADRCGWRDTYKTGCSDSILYFNGHPDYVEYIGWRNVEVVDDMKKFSADEVNSLRRMHEIRT